MSKLTEEKKKKVNSKVKGATFELKVTKLLNAEFQPMKFAKTPGSGARVGGKNFGAFGKFFSEEALSLFVGDVVPVNEADCDFTFRFVVECKAYKEAEKLEALLSGSSHIYAWMNEVLVDCVKNGKDGIVVFKWNNTPLYCAVTKDITLPETVQRIVLNNGIQVSHFNELIKHRDFWILPK